MFKVYDKDVKKDKDVYLKLVQDGDRILLIACDQDGNEIGGGNLLAVKKNGTVARFNSVNPDLGFKLNDSGQVSDYNITKEKTDDTEKCAPQCQICNSKHE